VTDHAALRRRINELVDEVVAIGEQIDHVPIGSATHIAMLDRQLEAAKEFASLFGRWLLTTEPIPELGIDEMADVIAPNAQAREYSVTTQSVQDTASILSNAKSTELLALVLNIYAPEMDKHAFRQHGGLCLD
jgi:hypothetical protein